MKLHKKKLKEAVTNKLQGKVVAIIKDQIKLQLSLIVNWKNWNEEKRRFNSNLIRYNKRANYSKIAPSN